MRISALLVTVLLASGGALFAQSAKEKLAPELRELPANANVDVIVQFDQPPTDAYHQKVFNRGGQLKYKLDFINSGAYKMPGSAVTDLAGDTAVTHISVDHKLGAKLDYTTAATNAGTVWSLGWIGTGIGVAVIDSGIHHSSDFANRIVYSQNFNGSGGSQDLFGHGTHVAGIIAGDGANSKCKGCSRILEGMAPNANLIDLRVLDANGEGSDSMVIAAINTAIQLQSTYNIRVINLSLGRAVTESYRRDPLCQAVESAWKAGIVVVVAAGNDGRDNSVGENGYGTINAPGNDPYAITVGAMKSMDTYTRTDDLIASYSSKGPTLYDNGVKPDLVAPGNHVVSVESPGNTISSEYPQTLVAVSYYNGTNSNSASTAYFCLNGTSMAAATVSGAIADLLQAHPSLRPDQVKARLMRTAYKTFPVSSLAVDALTGATYVSYYDLFTVGAGYLDLAAAVNSSYLPFGSSASPTASFNASEKTIIVNFSPLSAWDFFGSSIASQVWGNALSLGASGVSGQLGSLTNQLSSTSGIWATSAIWGASGVWGTSALWGASAIWGASSNSSATSAVWATATGSNDINVWVNGEK
ncbi:MAG: S8 family peptidase [Acidobacteriaceae bacterium]|nr:S8 family peptidase [Acidobacteriaceae bacterium]